MLVEFTSLVGDKIAVNADAVAWVEPASISETRVVFSGRTNDNVLVAEPYAQVVQKLGEAMG